MEFYSVAINDDVSIREDGTVRVLTPIKVANVPLHGGFATVDNKLYCIGVLKFNCDGAYTSSCSKAAFGHIAKDSGGLAQFWQVGRVSVSSAISTEAWALRIACIAAMEKGHAKVVFEFRGIQKWCLNRIACISLPV
ncbi:hypothetical protein RHMOL_Rhmol07G0296400 [Rhododendron molle]|uniref:Uncharacterized protein n=1 Tax=Rhododendron molle TaxID=49168 RepID=A0ACC0N771_RHOML|nr:hypothetical protein RHMOL_Rhmol07G0296400 [Rhododendron molle]